MKNALIALTLLAAPLPASAQPPAGWLAMKTPARLSARPTKRLQGQPVTMTGPAATADEAANYNAFHLMATDLPLRDAVADPAPRKLPARAPQRRRPVVDPASEPRI